MPRYSDTVQNRRGDAVVGASVAVYVAGTQTLASLFSDKALSAALNNPLTTNYSGQFAFHAAAGEYDLRVSRPGVPDAVSTVDLSAASGESLVEIPPNGASATAAINAALAADATQGRVTRLRAGTYTLTARIVMPSNSALVFDGPLGACVLNLVYPGQGQDVIFVGGDHVRIEGLELRANGSPTFIFGNGVDITNRTDVRIQRCRLLNAPDEGVLVSNSHDVVIEETEIAYSNDSAIKILNGSTGIHVRKRCWIHHNAGFGVFGIEGSDLHVHDNRFEDNLLEGVGLRWYCTNGTIEGNEIARSGDNGISITGRGFRVYGNYIHECAYHGICLYGSFNTVMGNRLVNNGQSKPINGQSYAGVSVRSDFGGLGDSNTVVGNFMDDDQAAMTQDHGVKLSGGYTAWTAGESIAPAAGAVYRYNPANSSSWRLYEALTAGTTAGIPSHTSGDSAGADGILWRYVGESTSNLKFLPSNNQIAANAIKRVGVSPYDLGSGYRFNTVVAGNRVRLSATENQNNTLDSADIYCQAATPEGTLVAPVGSLCLRTNPAHYLKTGYIKLRGAGLNTGWSIIQTNARVTNATLPTAPQMSIDYGVSVWNDDLKKPIFWSNDGIWVDALGNPI